MTALLSCERSTEVVLDFEEPQLTLNCIIDATNDSISATLSLTRPIISSEPFQKINDAIVELYEDKHIVGQFILVDSGLYVIYYNVFPGKEYEIIASVDDETVKGKTLIPDVIPFDLLRIDNEYDDFKLTFNNKDINNAYVWINVLSTYYFVADTLKKEHRDVIYSGSTCIDPFNREMDTYKQYAYLYNSYLFLAEYGNQFQIDVFFGLRGNARSNEIIVNIFDYHLSTYVKSSMIASDAERVKGKSPFYIDPASVYSNIDGGIGIVGSMNSNSREIFNQLIYH